MYAAALTAGSFKKKKKKLRAASILAPRQPLRFFLPKRHAGRFF
jgi:hypothetical protein